MAPFILLGILNFYAFIIIAFFLLGVVYVPSTTTKHHMLHKFFYIIYIISYNIACVNNTSPSCSAVVKIFEFLSSFMEVSFIEMICSDQSAYTYIQQGPQKSMRARPRHSSERGRET